VHALRHTAKHDKLAGFKGLPPDCEQPGLIPIFCAQLWGQLRRSFVKRSQVLDLKRDSTHCPIFKR
jgi:hypothetical protein